MSCSLLEMLYFPQYVIINVASQVRNKLKKVTCRLGIEIPIGRSNQTHLSRDRPDIASDIRLLLPLPRLAQRNHLQSDYQT